MSYRYDMFDVGYISSTRWWIAKEQFFVFVFDFVLFDFDSKEITNEPIQVVWRTQRIRSHSHWHSLTHLQLMQLIYTIHCF